MKALALLFPEIVIFGLAWWSGRLYERRGTALSTGERRELEARRAFDEDLAIKAAEHATLGDDFAVIVLSDITKQRRALSPNKKEK